MIVDSIAIVEALAQQIADPVDGAHDGDELRREPHLGVELPPFARLDLGLHSGELRAQVGPRHDDLVANLLQDLHRQVPDDAHDLSARTVRLSRRVYLATAERLGPGTGLAFLAIAIAGCHAARPPAIAEPAGVPVYTADVVATFPHAPEAFTQGLELYRGRLYESTGLHGHSSVRVVDLETGRVDLRTSVAAEHYAEGLTVLDGHVYQLTYQSQRCFVYDAETLEPITEHTYPGEGWGLTHADGSLILSDGTSVLRFLDPDTLAEQRRLTVREGTAPVDQLNELEMVEGELFANVWMSDRIARIDLATGQVTGWIELAFLREGLGLTEPQAVLNGIAYDADRQRLFVTGKLWPALYEIRVRPR